MTRATPLAPDDRRRAIVEATLPLLLDRGPELSTREIAQAAGVAEGTIFRAFETKQDLIHACMHAALAPDAALAELAALPDGQDLTARTASVLAVLDAELQRKRALFASLFGNGRPAPPPGRGHGPGHGSREESQRQLLEAVGAALAPYADQLRVPVDTGARILSTLAFAAGFGVPDAERTTTAHLADVVLHGIAQGGS